MWVPDVMGRTANKGALLTWLCPMATAFFQVQCLQELRHSLGWRGELEGKTGRRAGDSRVDGQLAGGLTDTQKEQMALRVCELTEFHLPRKVQRWAWTGTECVLSTLLRPSQTPSRFTLMAAPGGRHTSTPFHAGENHRCKAT